MILCAMMMKMIDMFDLGESSCDKRQSSTISFPIEYTLELVDNFQFGNQILLQAQPWECLIYS